MFTILSALVSVLSCRFRGRSSLELEVVALRHQLAVLRRQHPRQTPYRCLGSASLGFVVQTLAAMPRGHGAGKTGNCDPVASSGLPALLAVAIETPLSRSAARRLPSQGFDPPNESSQPALGAPRIHGELLKLGIRIGQTAVAKYMARRPRAPSPSWRTFLKQHVEAIAAIDMFIVVSATFQMLYVVIVLKHDRRRIAHFGVTRHPTQVWLPTK